MTDKAMPSTSKHWKSARNRRNTARLSKIDAVETTENDPTTTGNVRVVDKIVGSQTFISCDSLESKPLLATGTGEGSIEIRLTYNNRLVRTLESDHKTPTTCVSLIEKSQNPFCLASYGSGDTTLWNCKTGNIEWNLAEEQQTLVNRFDNSKTSFVTAGTGNKINLYDIETRKLIRTFEASDAQDVMDGHVMRIFNVTFHPVNPDEFISGGWDNTIQFWDIRSVNSIRKLFGPHICGDGISFLRDGNEFVTTSWSAEKSIQQWDYCEGSLIDTIVPDSYISLLYSCDYVETDGFIVTGGCQENLFRAVNMDTKLTFAMMRQLSDSVNFVKVLPQSSVADVLPRIVVGSGSNLYFLEVLLEI